MMKYLLFIGFLIIAPSSYAGSLNIQSYFYSLEESAIADIYDEEPSLVDIKNGYLKTESSEYVLYYTKDKTPLIVRYPFISGGYNIYVYSFSKGKWKDITEQSYPQITRRLITQYINKKGISLEQLEVISADNVFNIDLPRKGKEIIYSVFKKTDLHKPIPLFTIIFENDKFILKDK